jgi:hypothetical protein
LTDTTVISPATDHAINLLDTYSRPDEGDVHDVDVAWTLQQRTVATSANRRSL